MPSLVAATLLWALSFGLIARYLGGLDPNFVAAARLGLALPLFLPGLRLRGLDVGTAGRLAAIGALQFGVMYVAYIAAYRFASGHEIALFTVLTPIYVALLDGAYAGRVDLRALGLAGVATLGAAVIVWRGTFGDVWEGFVLVQVANLCFAWGQIAYRRLRRRRPELSDGGVFALLLGGGLVVTAAAATASGGWSSLGRVDVGQALVLGYLGVVATGVGFFLWNRGAVVTATGVLAVMNDLKVPLGVAAALAIFGEEADPLRLTVGGGLMVGAAILAARPGGASPR